MPEWRPRVFLWRFTLAVLFPDSWQSRGFGAWRGNQFVTGGMTLVPGRSGETAVRVVVAPGDDPINASGERAEVAFPQTTTDVNPRIGETDYISFGIRLADDWQEVSRWGIVWQSHLQSTPPSPEWSSPNLYLNVRNTYRLVTNAGMPPAQGTTNFVNYDVGTPAPGQWVDWIIGAHWALAGHVDVWRRLEGEEQFTKVLDLDTPTVQANASGVVYPMYHKHGLYRSEETFTHELLLDGFQISESFDEAAEGRLVSVLSSSVVEDRPQSDGRRSITESHVDDRGREHRMSYLAEPSYTVDLDVTARRIANRVARAEQDDRDNALRSSGLRKLNTYLVTADAATLGMTSEELLALQDGGV